MTCPCTLHPRKGHTDPCRLCSSKHPARDKSLNVTVNVVVDPPTISIKPSTSRTGGDDARPPSATSCQGVAVRPSSRTSPVSRSARESTTVPGRGLEEPHEPTETPDSRSSGAGASPERTATSLRSI